MKRWIIAVAMCFLGAGTSTAAEVALSTRPATTTQEALQMFLPPDVDRETGLVGVATTLMQHAQRVAEKANVQLTYYLAMVEHLLTYNQVLKLQVQDAQQQLQLRDATIGRLQAQLRSAEVTIELLTEMLPARSGPDLNSDGAVDDADAVIWSVCRTGAALSTPARPSDACWQADLDGDRDVDMDDYGILQRARRRKPVASRPASQVSSKD